MLEDLIAAHLVLPNRVTVPVKKGLDITNLRFPLPSVSTGSWLECWANEEGRRPWLGSEQCSLVAILMVTHFTGCTEAGKGV